MRVSGVRKQVIFATAAAGETQIRSSAKTGKADGNVRIRAVLPSREWIQRNERPVGSHSLKSLIKITIRERSSAKTSRSFFT